jgi:nucleoside-diphosphate-sugar epimerase
MNKNILIIGGTRFFGKLLAERLLDVGHRVTIATRGQVADHFGGHVQRIKVDRRDATAMQEAFRNIDGYDLVYDQMCYSPLDAMISAEVFGSKVDRYVMASTIEVYQHLQGAIERPFLETDLNPGSLPIEPDRPWHTPEFAERFYGLGKRQAEAYFYQDGRLPLVSVRIGHVLAGPQDFTERLAYYVKLAASGKPLQHSAHLGKSSFTSSKAISDFLFWVGEQSFSDAINSACDGELNALDIYQRVCALMQKKIVTVPVFAAHGTPTSAPALSPFDYHAPYAMNTGRAKVLGYRFSHSKDWLDDLILQHVATMATAESIF